MAYNEGMSPADYAAINNGGGFGNGNDWWILLFLLWGRNGWGNQGGGNCGANATCATPADVNAAVDQQTLISKLDQQTYGIADATFALNNTITNGFSQAELSRCNQQAALMQQLFGMQSSADKCCCETQRLMERGFADTNYNLAQQFCDTRYQAERNTRDIIDNANCNTRAILDFLNQSKIDTLQQENQTLRLQASQAAQNTYLINQLRPSPVPAYTVANPYCCAPSPCGCGTGYGNGYGYAAG